MLKNLLTVQEIAEILKVTTTTVYRWINKGKLPAIKIGKEWRVKEADLENMLKENNKKQTCKTESNIKLEDLKLGQHYLGLIDQKENIIKLEAKFLKVGLERGYYLFKGCWWQNPDNVRSQLEEHGLNVKELESNRRLKIVDLRKEYQKNGVSGAVNAWQDSLLKAKELDYKGLWGSGSPMVSVCDKSSDLIKFEDELNQLVKDEPIIIICPYPYSTEFSRNNFFKEFFDLQNCHSGLILSKEDSLHIMNKNHIV